MSSSESVSPRAAATVCIATLLTLGPTCASSQRDTDRGGVGLPKLPDHFVLRPRFITQKGALNAGTAFPIDIKNQARLIVLTAVHLFGPAGGLPQQIPSADIPKYVGSVTLSDAFTGEEVAKGGPMIDLPEAMPWNKADTGDVAAFWAAKDGRLGAAKLAEASPSKGETIWLAASLIDGPERDQPLHRAVVVLSKKEGMNFQYDTPHLNLVATSGAP